MRAVGSISRSIVSGERSSIFGRTASRNGLRARGTGQREPVGRDIENAVERRRVFGQRVEPGELAGEPEEVRALRRAAYRRAGPGCGGTGSVPRRPRRAGPTGARLGAHFCVHRSRTRSRSRAHTSSPSGSPG